MVIVAGVEPATRRLMVMNMRFELIFPYMVYYLYESMKSATLPSELHDHKISMAGISPAPPDHSDRHLDALTHSIDIYILYIMRGVRIHIN